MAEHDVPARDQVAEWVERFQQEHPESRVWAEQSREAEDSKRRASAEAGITAPPIARYSTVRGSAHAA